MSNFGRQHFYLLNEKMEIDLPGLKRFLHQHENKKILLFGFTFMVWEFFYKKLQDIGEFLDMGNSTLIHSGGWKKLEDQAVSNNIFKESIRTQTGIENIYNFYGMAEQLGSIFMECDQGHLHASIFSDIIIRDPFDWSPSPVNQKGIIEVFSILPRSYPGHVLLTEDIGMLLGEDDCPCGRKGKYFKVIGRAAKSENRGCSDTYENHEST